MNTFIFHKLEVSFGRLPAADAIPTEEMGDCLPVGPALAMSAIFRCIGDFFLAMFSRKLKSSPPAALPAAERLTTTTPTRQS